jgi:hypothetical protein
VHCEDAARAADKLRVIFFFFFFGVWDTISFSQEERGTAAIGPVAKENVLPLASVCRVTLGDLEEQHMHVTQVSTRRSRNNKMLIFFAINMRLFYQCRSKSVCTSISLAYFLGF